MTGRRLAGRVIYPGEAAGTALCTDAPISFYGGVDLTTGVVAEAGHPLQGQSLAGKVLVFPTGKGSTVGSYALLRLAKEGLAPSALVMSSCDTTVAVGAIISEIPCVDRIEVDQIATGDEVSVDGEEVLVR